MEIEDNSRASMDAVNKALLGATKSLVHPIILMILVVPMWQRWRAFAQGPGEVQGLGARGKAGARGTTRARK